MYEILAMSGRYVIFFIAIMIFLNILLLSKGHNREVTEFKDEFNVDESSKGLEYVKEIEPIIPCRIKIKNLLERNINESSVVQVDLSKDVTIGRGEDNKVVLLDNSISKNHAVIYSKGTKYYIEDLNSTNGTYVNGKRIKKAFNIDEKSKIQIGPLELTLRYT